MEEHALLTESEREVIRGDSDENARAEMQQRLQDRLESLRHDLELLATAEPALFEQVQQTVETVSAERTETTDDQVPTLGQLAFPHDDDRCKAAVYAAREYIRASEGATRRDIVSQVMPAHPLTYQVDEALRTVESGEEYDGGWWTEVVGPGLEILPTVECPEEPGGEYHLVDAN